ncbi:phosphoglycerate mutase [Podospora fimiseda]|uniref:Phosphoglycerate mutase n=1 Tax=Podospora fimiseda TaxID=252190 RepID=A0AAN7BQM9_9PEZI|nr:phosphoglycerate mutase [Podospora fimiseda]
MTLEYIYITRHGFRSNWVVDHQTGSYTSYLRTPTGIPADPALTAHGVDQAKQLGARLLALSIDRVYSSLYYRCLQTVEPYVRQSGHKIKGETGIGEWYGSAPFEHPVPASLEILDTHFPDMLDLTYKPLVTPTRMGESVDELHDRVALAMDKLIEECDRDGVKAVLLCSHAAPIIALGRVLTGNMPDNIEVEDFRAFTCGLSVYRRRGLKPGTSLEKTLGTSQLARNGMIPDAGASESKSSVGDSSWRGGRGVRGGWECKLNSDCAHLELGEERGWRFSGDESFKDDGILDAGTELGVIVEGRNKGKL